MYSLPKWLAILQILLCVLVLTRAHDSIEYERYDGWFNNLANPSWGSVATPLSRVVPAIYEDGVYQPSGGSRADPIEISDELMSDKLNKNKTKSFRNASVLMVYFGQHITHEIVDTSRPGCPPENAPIKNGDRVIPFRRSNYDSSSGKSPNTPRQQLNEATPWLDGGAIYGTSKIWADALRTFKDGRLETNDIGNWPQSNTVGLPMYNLAIPSTNTIENVQRIPKVGNKRANENPFLLSLCVLWFRYHNLMADKIKRNNPTWNDDKIFNEARKWVIATYQHIVLYEWLPTFLGGDMTKETFKENYKYNGYKSSVHPGINHIFQSAAMRFAETMVPSQVTKRNPNICHDKTATYHIVRLCNHYWNSQEILVKNFEKEKDSIRPLIYGMVNQQAEAEDNVIVEDLRVYTYGPLHHTRRDLVALNIERGRDHGLPDYNTARKAFGLKPMETFYEINNDTDVIPKEIFTKMMKQYNYDIDNVDIWVGGMMESGKHGPGELFRNVILDQFLRIRDGDRFWYENYRQTKHFTDLEIEEIKKTKFKDIITNCTNVKSSQLQENVFLVTDAKCPIIPTDGLKQKCTKLKTYDYFSGSEVSFALTFLLVGLLPFFAVCMLCALATVRNEKREKQIKQLRKRSTRKSIKRDEMSRFTAIEWENKISSRPVTVIFGPGSCIRVLSIRNDILRIIDTQHLKWITAIKQGDKQENTLSLRIQREYDLVLTFNTTEERDSFLEHLKAFINETYPEFQIQEHHRIGCEIFAHAVTRKARQGQLEKFFKAAFARAFDLDFGEDKKCFKLNANQIKEILSCELSQTEFAHALAMQPNSPFVSQMFQLVDKDSNGYLSFKEFLDLIFIFAKGTPEDKLKLFFDMYDINGEGKLDRDAFKKMMRSLVDVVSASIEAENLDQLVESMFTSKGGEKEFLNFDDFGAIMLDLDRKEGLLSNVNNVFEGATTPRKKEKTRRRTEPKIQRQRQNTLISRQRDGENLTSNTPPLTPSKTSRRFTLASLQGTNTGGNNPHWLAISRFIENHRQHIFLLTLYTLIMLGLFCNTAYMYSVEKEHSGLRQVTGYGIVVSRAAAATMMFTFSTLLVTMSRNTITFLRETSLMHWIPFDSAIAFHKYVATWALFFTVAHTIGHAFNFYHLATQSPTDLSCLLRNDFHRSHELPKFHHYCWQTITGTTGVLLCIVLVAMYVFASQFARRSVFNWFWWTHQLYIALYALTILHGSGHLIQAPTFHLYLLGPAVLFTVDKLISMARKKVEIPVTKAELLPSDVTHLEFKRPVNFNYKSGQWVRIACLELGGSEYHPFTLTSAPHEENLSLHIRAVGPWTMNMRHTYNKENLQDRPFPMIYLDGPFGEGHQDWYRFEVSVLVGGGIGVTPFASILKDIAHKGTLNSTFACKQVYFLWVTRTQKHFEWLTDIIREVEEKDTKGLVTVHIFVTQFYEKFDLRTTMLYICERHFQRISGRSLFTGLQSITHFGRPDFNSTLNSISVQHPEVGKIGVFSCGPPAMTRSVEKTCAQLNIDDGPTFIHHFENF